MKSLSHFLIFLMLTMLLSFAFPIIFVGGGLASLALLHYLPSFEAIAQFGIERTLQFLAVFGSGCPVAGVLTIGLTCGFVGGLFTLCTNYRYRHFLS